GAHINLGAVLNLLQQYDEAVTALRKGIQIDGQRVEGYYNLGLVYKRKGQSDLAITAYKEALRINPRMADAHLNLGNLYLEREHPRMALHHYEQAAQLRPGWDKAIDGMDQSKAALAGEAPAQEAAEAIPGTPAARPGSGIEADRLVDPIAHGAFLSNLHQATIVAEETGRLLQMIIGEEGEPVIKELATVLVHNQGPRSGLGGCLAQF